MRKLFKIGRKFGMWAVVGSLTLFALTILKYGFWRGMTINTLDPLTPP